jgi:hypothetical protein
VVVASAAVVAFGNMVLIHAQNPKWLPQSITQVDYRFKHVGPIEITSEVLNSGRSALVPAIPALSTWGLLTLMLLLMTFGIVWLHRRQDARKAG